MDLNYYLSLVPGSSMEKSRFMQLLSAILQQVIDLMNVIPDIQGAYSCLSASGDMLNAYGESIGLFREEGMSDTDYRNYIKAKLALWCWDGTNSGLPAALVALPGVTIGTDNNDCTETVSPASTRKDLVPCAAGVRIIT